MSAPWPEVPLTDVADLIRGVSYPKSDSRGDSGPGYVPVLRATNIQDARLVLESDLVYVAASNVSPDQRLRPGDIVIATSSGSKHLVGKSALLRSAWDGSFGAFCAGIRPKANIDPRYLAYFLQSPRYWKEIGKKALGVNINNLRRGDLETLLLPLPSVAEQRELVDEVEKQFSRLDEAVANLKRVKANLRRFKAAVLKAAVEGRLVPNEAHLAHQTGRSLERGEDLLGRIHADRRRLWRGRGRYREPAAPRSEWQYPLPDGWVWATLGHLAHSVKDGPHYSPKYSRTGIPFISGGNVRPEGIDFSTAKFIEPELHAALSERCKPEFGDLLYTKGGTTGIARVNTEHREFNVWVHVAVLKLVPDVHPFYVQHALNSEYCYRQAQQYTHGVGNQDLGLTRMVWITIPLPPRLEQDRIVGEVDRHLSIARELEYEIEVNLKRAQALGRACLTEAFAKCPTSSASKGKGAPSSE